MIETLFVNKLDALFDLNLALVNIDLGQNIRESLSNLLIHILIKKFINNERPNRNFLREKIKPTRNSRYFTQELEDSRRGFKIKAKILIFYQDSYMFL